MEDEQNDQIAGYSSTATKRGNLLGIHALVWVGGWTHDECREAISKSYEAGYDIIEIPALDPEIIDIEYTKEVLKEYNMRATVSLGLNFDADINNEDPDIVKRGLDTLMGALQIVEQLDTCSMKYLGGVLYSALGKYNFGPPTSKARINVAQSLKTLAQRAQKNNIIVGLEPVNRYESNLINTTQQCLDLINEIDEDNVKVHLDIYHMNIEENDLVTPVVQCSKEGKLGYVHIGSNHRGPLSTGSNINYDQFFDALIHICNYDGIITFESFSSCIVDNNLTTTLAIWRNLWTDNMKLAIDAKEFIETKIVVSRKC